MKKNEKVKVGTLAMLVGIPGSGKSTYAKKVVEMNPTWGYVSRDAVRYEYVSDQAHYFDHEDEVFKEFCKRVEKYLRAGRTVIADATFINKKSREWFIQNLEVQPENCYAIVIDTPFEICMERNAAREGITRVPDQSMYNMKHRYSAPNLGTEEYLNRVYTVKGV